ncbi:MAG: bifunctional (p)ppGpp synthetase/guanosine-3',5'-bis(diphosphate) 3'-pyrophosphohydrolase [Chloroflexi bacterium]|nr:MAG: bifunctional (p)ppGpp synthetase/guanosine-3',5'-bis(diphosphate) 3'-pyrophosphohydrolase [Chloroflexota bacterium]
MRAEVFQDRVYVFTPKGDIIDLPAGATPIDFAYHIHTEIGHRCRGAKVDGRLVPLDYTLKTSDRVEILTAKRGGPSMDWLNPDLGYVKTSRARSKIRHWFRKQNRDKHIALGRDVLERELRRLGMSERITFESVAHLFDYEELEDFLAAIGVGDINSSQIANRLLAEEKQREEERRQEELLNPPSTSVKVGDVGTNSILIQGADGLLVTIAKCCRPMPGDPIIGYITRGRGVTVHRTSCKNIQNLSDPERLIDVSWSNVLAEETYTVPIEIVAYDREGLMRDISTIIADEKINLSDVRVSTRQNIATFHLMMEIRNASQLTRVMNRLDGIPSVVEVHRRQMV